MNKEEFINELKKINIIITKEQLSKFNKYYELLVEENRKYNLTNIIKEEEVYLKHFYDSLTLIKAIDLNKQYICDIGTGAGFPGIVLKIVFPDLKIDLLEATLKKCKFLELVINNLNLQNINVINARAEEYAKENREKYDLVVSRAVANLKHLLEFGIPMLKTNGIFIALKANIEEELVNIDNYYKKLSLVNENMIRFKLPSESSNRTIYMITKKEKTNKIYPRTYSQIKKHDI